MTAALKQMQTWLKAQKRDQLQVEVEARTLDEVKEVLAFFAASGNAGVHRILLDNMVKVASDGTVDVSLLQEALALVGDRKSVV